MLKIIIVCFFATFLLGFSTPIKQNKQIKKIFVIKNQKSEYKIVLPVIANKALARHLHNAAKEFSQIIADSYGVNLPVVTEEKLPKNSLGIYIGNTIFARKNNIDVTKLKPWQSINKVIGNNIVLVGLDTPVAKNVNSSSYNYLLGSCKAISEFLKAEVGVRFLLPGINGTYIPRNNELILPSDFEKISTPIFEFCRTRPLPILFESANNLFPSGKTFLYGGHSYYAAVPKKKYGKSNPEYFQLSGKSRSIYGNHLCISNKNVQELIYQEMLKKLDAGYETVELAQTDDYQQCQCEKCVNLYGVKDPGEQLWIFHKKLAERLYKDRPNKKVLIIGYGHTFTPPKTFKKFPPNTAIELCRTQKEFFDMWKNYEVPQGFVVYIYNWGAYNLSGLSPKHTYDFLSEQMKLFRKNNVKAIYICGSTDLWGLEGPAYYVFYRLMENANLSPYVAANEFYSLAYQEAEIPMRSFFQTIDKRLRLYPRDITNKEVREEIKPANLLPSIWDPATLKTLQRQLSAAEKIAKNKKVKARIALVRAEFDYFYTTVRALSFYNSYRLEPSWNSLELLAQEVAKRNLLIDKYYPKRPKALAYRLPDWKSLPLFGYNTRNDFIQNGSLRGAINSPFSWDFDMLKKLKVLPSKDIPKILVKKISNAPDTFDFNAPCWGGEPMVVMNGIQLGKPSVKTSFKVVYDDHNLYVAFEGERKYIRTYRSLGYDGNCWGQDCFEILLDPLGFREKHFHFMFNAVENSSYDAISGFNNDELNPNVNKADATWNGKWSYKNQLTPTKWKAIVTIPFTTLGVSAPKKGTIWTANFGREEYHNKEKYPELLLWSPNPEARKFSDRDKFGELIFE